MNCIPSISALTVCFETANLLFTAYETFRAFNPDMPLTIVDGSAPGSDCYKYVEKLTARDRKVAAMQVGYNIGHGHGMHYGIHKAETDLILIFDSDVEFLKNPVPEMLELISPNRYGVGWVYEIGPDGYDYGTFPNHLQHGPIPYLHPYFHLLNREMYGRFLPYCHHGAPSYRAMKDIYEHGLSAQLLVNFDGLTGHSKGEGMNWKAREPVYIRHDFGGTRTANRKRGLKEVPGTWER